MLKVDKGFVILDTSTLPRRIIFSALILALFTPAIYRNTQILRADRIVRTEQTFESYSRALQYDSSNATLWWRRGRLRHYSLEAADMLQAIGDYQKALSLNPRLSQAWADLADCYERIEKYAEAEDALNNALATHTFSPLIRWQAGNFFLRRGNLPRMYDCFRMASEYGPEKLGIAMEIAWKVDTNHAAILQKLIPDNLAADMRYLEFLLSRDELDLARAAWERAMKNEIPLDSEFKVASSFAYIDRLLAKSRVEDAERIWDEAHQKAGTGLRDTRIVKEEPAGRASDSPNLVWNGSFENEILRGGFDWRYADMQEVQYQIDLVNRMEGLKCFRVTFGGSNIHFEHLRQFVPIPHPGGYVLDFYLRTEGLTTDQRPFISIQGYPEPGGATLRTELFPESTPWKKMSFPFVVRENCRAIQLILRRNPSSKFDNQLKGSLWLDGFSIHAVPNSTAAGR